jgi:hypothetical protein
MNLKGRTLLPLMLLAGTLALVTAVQVANAIHPRPKAAQQIRVSLVPAYEPCTSPNASHAPPLAFPSCTPPVPASDHLTVGTPDANGAPAKSVGGVVIRAQAGSPGPPEDAAFQIRGEITDVRCQAGVSTTCGQANETGGPDYTGELEGTMTLRVTDHFNGPDRNEAATLVDLPQTFNPNCGGNDDPTVGSTCVFPVVTCSSCPPPKEGVRTVIEVSQVTVRDGGADGSALTSEDNTLFMVQGVFVP